MNSQLIIHQPYRTLTALQADFSLSQDEIALAWSVINDHYMTDLPLLYPPHIVALTAILLALVLSPPKVSVSGASSTGNTNSAGLAAASAALAQVQVQVQARAAIQGGGSGANTPNLTPQSSQGSQTSSATAVPQGEGSSEKKVPDVRLSKVQRFAAWLAESNVDIEAMVDTTQELISFYECHEQYNDKITREQINRFVKARGLDK
jgi:cyclin C